MADTPITPPSGPRPGGGPGAPGGGKGQEAAKVVSSAKNMKEADTSAGKVQHGAKAAGDIGKNAGGAHGAAIGGAGQGVSEVARVKDQGGTAKEQVQAGVKGAAVGAATGALGGKDGGQIEGAVDKIDQKRAEKKADSAIPTGGDTGERKDPSKDPKSASDGGDKEGKGEKPDKPEKDLHGASGTAETDGKGKDKSAEGIVAGGKGDPLDQATKSGMGDKAGLAAGSVLGAQAGGQLLIGAMFMTMMAGVLGAVTAAASGLMNWGLALLAWAGSKAIGFLGAIGGAVSGFLGGAVSATVASFMVGGLVVGGGAVAITGVAAVATTNAAARDGAIVCTVSQQDRDKVSSPVSDAGAETLANAEKIYSVLKAWGMGDENIAGILGNWKAESGINPTSVQNHSTADFTMTDAKKEAAKNTDNGIGLGQWTSERNSELRDFAGSKDWWTVETQLAFMIGPDRGAGVVKDMIANNESTPEAAVKKFHDEWERSADTSMDKRNAAASEMFAIMGDWSANKSLADSILSQAGTNLDGANSGRAEQLEAAEVCDMPDQSGLEGLAEGGMSMEEATALMEYYKANGLSQLLSMYPGEGGPGHCGNDDKSDNCVGFSTWFFNTFTTNKSYPNGNGLETAKSVAALTGGKLSDTPTVYSVFSVPANVPGFTFAEGHTGVVLGIEGDKMIVGEANCGSNHARTQAIEVPISQAKSQGWVFADVTDVLDAEAMKGYAKK